jgi:acyl dehydratase
MEGIPSEAKARIGREVVHVYDVTDKDIRRFAQAIDDPNPLYYDEEYAKKTIYKGIIAPPLFCHAFTFADVPAGSLREDGLPKELDVPLPVNRAIGGSSSFEVGTELRPGDKLTVKSKVLDIYTKSGKTGLLYFVVVETTFTNQNGDIAAREVATYIQR